MNAQEIFDAALAALREQGEQSMHHDHNVCAYRGLKGNKCAVGHLIADAEYSPDMETFDVGGVNNKGLLPARLIPHIPLLRDMQIAHDDAGDLGFMDNFERRMRDVADLHGLVYKGQA